MDAKEFVDEDGTVWVDDLSPSEHKKLQTSLDNLIAAYNPQAWQKGQELVSSILSILSRVKSVGFDPKHPLKCGPFRPGEPEWFTCIDPSDTLHKLLDDRKITHGELGEWLGVKERSGQRYVRDPGMMRAAQVQTVCEKLDVTLDYLQGHVKETDATESHAGTIELLATWDSLSEKDKTTAWSVIEALCTAQELSEQKTKSRPFK